MSNIENINKEPIDLSNPILAAKLHKLVRGTNFNHSEGYQPFEFNLLLPYMDGIYEELYGPPPEPYNTIFGKILMEKYFVEVNSHTYMHHYTEKLVNHIN